MAATCTVITENARQGSGRRCNRPITTDRFGGVCKTHGAKLDKSVAAGVARLMVQLDELGSVHAVHKANGGDISREYRIHNTVWTAFVSAVENRQEA